MTMKYKQNQMMDFILDVLKKLQQDNDFDRAIVKKVLGTGLKQHYPLTRYYIPKEL